MILLALWVLIVVIAASLWAISDNIKQLEETLCETNNKLEETAKEISLLGNKLMTRRE